MSFIEIPEHTAAWHAHRRKFIGGSEVAALFSVDPTSDDEERVGGYESIYSLYSIKGGAVAPRVHDNARMKWGRRFEPVIAEAIAEERGWTLRKGRYAIDDTTPGMGASLDYEVVGAGEDAQGVPTGGDVVRGLEIPLAGPGALQIKQVDGRQFARAWINGEPPIYVLLQLQHELACSGYAWGVVGAWVGGNRPALYFYEARPGVIAEIRRRVAAFWRMVAEQRPPNPDGSDASAYVLRELFPVVQDTPAPVDLTGDNEVPLICEELANITPVRLRLEKREEELKAVLQSKLGAATYGRCGAWEIRCVVTRANPGREAKPGEIIGRRQEGRKYSVKEIV